MPAFRLDDLAGEIGPAVAVMKVDVEGHEAAVFRGASRLLSSGVVRNVIFEAHVAEREQAAEGLTRAGYTVFALERTLARPYLAPPTQPPGTKWHAPSLIATRDPEGLRRAFRRWGWLSLTSAWRP